MSASAPRSSSSPENRPEQPLQQLRQRLRLLRRDWDDGDALGTVIGRLDRLFRAVQDHCILRLNRNRRVLVSLRRPKEAGLTLSLHHGVLDHPDALPDIERFVFQRGRGSFPRLNAAMQQVFQQVRVLEPPKPRPEPISLPTIGLAPLDLAGELHALRERYFPDLDDPLILWGRDPGLRHIRQIRFGSYRYRPTPHIRLHPRLGLPWVARVFVESVIHHELCHHAQARDRIRGEKPHSPRFKAWERQFEHFDEARQWESAMLPRFLVAPDPVSWMQLRCTIGLDTNDDDQSAQASYDVPPAPASKPHRQPPPTNTDLGHQTSLFDDC